MSKKLRLSLAQSPENVQTNAEYENLTKDGKMQEEIRKAKLKDVKRMQKELESKLEALSENFGLITTPTPNKKELNETMKKEKLKEKEDLELKKKQAAETIQKIKEESKEWKRKKTMLKKQQEEQQRKLDEEAKIAKQKAEEQEKKAKEERLAEIEEQKKKREEEIKKAKELAKAKMKPATNYVYKKLEEKYTNEIVLPELEKKKEELAKKRNLFKPVRNEDLEEHKRKYDLYIAGQEELRKQEIKKRKEREEQITESLNKCKTSTLEKVNEMETKEKIENEMKKNRNKILREKIKSYANLVKETCPVETSSEKAEQLKKLIANLKQPVRKIRDTRKSYELATLNNRKSSKVSAKSIAGGQLNSKTPREVSEALTEDIPKHKPLDYLAELRKRRAENYNTSKSIAEDWKKDLLDGSLKPAEKYTRMMGKANIIEEKAKMNELLLRAKGGAQKNPEMGEHVSDMFIDAIKAKLAILENL